MVIELVVRDGRYINMYPDAQQETIIDMVDAKGFEDNSQTKKDSQLAKKKALAIAKNAEKEGWKKVAIFPHYSYGYPNPYRYEILAFGGYGGK